MYRVKNNRLYRTDGWVLATPEKWLTFVETPEELILWNSRNKNRTLEAALIFLAETSLEDGYYRMRRGSLVKIPDQWVGQIPGRRKIRHRLSISRRTRKEK